MSFPNATRMAKAVSTPEDAIQFCQEAGWINQPTECPHCQGALHPVNAGQGLLRCTRAACRHYVNLTTGTIFKSKLPINKVLHLLYLWACGNTHSYIRNMTGCSASTVSRLLRRFNNLLIYDQENRPAVMIGGPGVIVEVDESKFGKRKYHRGQRVEGVWVFGGVERTPERKLFLQPVMTRDHRTLREIIRRNIAPGTIIHSDKWKGYRPADMRAMGMRHFTVNHSRHFVDPVTGVHTNTIEGTWNGVKQKINKRHRTHHLVEGYLAQFVFRRMNKGRIWSALSQVIRTAHAAAGGLNVEDLDRLQQRQDEEAAGRGPLPESDSDSDSDNDEENDQEPECRIC